MGSLSVLRAFFAILSLCLLAASAYLLWSWYDGEWVRDAEGVLRRVREDWRLWTGGSLLAWSFLGRSVVLLLVARGDTDPMRLERGNGTFVDSPTGARLYVEIHGSDDLPPLILTHGWSLDSRIWHYAKRDLGRHFQLIVWDLPGLGQSKRARAKVDMRGFAQDLAAVLQLAGGRPAVLAGHSIGGMIIQTLVRDQPELSGSDVRGVVLLNTTYTNPLKTMILSGLAQALRWPVIEPLMRLTILLQPLAWLAAWQSYLSGTSHLSTRLGFGRSVTRTQLDCTARLMTMQNPAVTAHGDLAMFRWSAEEALRACPVPILVLGGSKDIVTKAEASEHIAHIAPRGQLQIMEGANHMGPIAQAAAYHTAIIDFAQAVHFRGPTPL
ncbi:pimeloyl-ACP methyl ester carboxylesterase [Sphingomonas trueperi]|uniref:alpha/beta fold hydrolase n=1 Tax=Sphingomonas trueperi TaxID=53317 RepID=UPI00339A4706